MFSGRRNGDLYFIYVHFIISGVPCSILVLSAVEGFDIYSRLSSYSTMTSPDAFIPFPASAPSDA
jgi:hypothetical protein